jgi:hypothetical protein
MVTFPRMGEQVEALCIFCKRAPVEGETYGPHAEGWDHTGICPGCWNEATEPEDEEEVTVLTYGEE